MRKWRCISHPVKKGKNPLKNKHWIETAGSQKERKTEANLEKDLFGGSRKKRQNMD
jgi:hypothetical protein